MRSALFATRYPHLVRGKARSGRPGGEGVQKTVKFFLPSHLVEWFDSQPSKAGTVVRGLEELHDREVKSKKRKSQ